MSHLSLSPERGGGGGSGRSLPSFWRSSRPPRLGSTSLLLLYLSPSGLRLRRPSSASPLSRRSRSPLLIGGDARLRLGGLSSLSCLLRLRSK